MPRRLPATGAILAFALFTAGLTAVKAERFDWNSATGNSNFSAPGNWSNNTNPSIPGPPGSGDLAVIRTTGSTPLQVDLDQNAGVVKDLEVNDHRSCVGKAGVDLTLPGGNSFTTTGNFVLGSGSLRLSPGAVLNTGFSRLGSSSVRTGQTSAVVDRATWNVAGSIIGLEVGVDGNSILTIQNGGQVLSTNSTYVSGTWQDYQGNGTIVVTGAHSLLESGSMAIGVGSGQIASTWGQGTVQILDGGTVRTTSSSKELTIGERGLGTVVVDGAGSTLDVHHNIALGGYNSGVVGTGHLTIQNGGTLTTPTDTYSAGRLGIGGSTGSTFNVTTGGKADLRDLNAYFGGVTIEQGGTVNVSDSANLGLSDNPLDRGSVIKDAGTSFKTKYLSVDAKRMDAAALSIRNGATVEVTDQVYIGYYGRNAGRLDVDAAKLIAGWSLNVGNDSNGVRRQGQLNLSNGAEVTSKGPLYIRPDSVVDVSGGSRLHLDSIGDMSSGSVLSVHSGGIATFGRSNDAANWSVADSVYVGKDSQIRGSGQIDSDVVVGDGGMLDPGSMRKSYGKWGFGDLAIDGDLNLMLGSLLSLGVGNNSFDFLDVSGDLTLAGTVEVEFASDFTWQDNLFLNLIRSGGVFNPSGVLFKFLGSSAQTDGLTWYTSNSGLTLLRQQDLDDFLNSNSTVPEPSSFAAWSIFSIAALFIRRRRRKKRL